MNELIHYHGGSVCPPHPQGCNQPPITPLNEFDCSSQPGSTLRVCRHLT